MFKIYITRYILKQELKKDILLDMELAIPRRGANCFIKLGRNVLLFKGSN